MIFEGNPDIELRVDYGIYFLMVVQQLAKVI